ncbi:hypothetical protein OA959_00140 [SAR86 cluster bacterium]|nr:hypothetical protein [SAR86 cluster bacterium]
MYQLNKLFIGIFVVLSSNLVFGETWKCNFETTESEVEWVRVDDRFEVTYKGGKESDLEELIMENDKEIILYDDWEKISIISVLNKEYKTITTFIFDGNHPKHLPFNGFGNCEIFE